MRGQGVPRRVVLVGCGLVALAALGLVVRHLWVRDTARVVDASDALQRFRDQTTTVPAATPSTATAPASTIAITTTTEPLATTPTPGVYRYRTKGHESIDVLGGARHRYPGETTVTVTADGCGALLRWDVLVERREEWRLCATGAGIELGPGGEQLHQFFGRGDAETLLCDRPVLLVAPAPAPSAAVPLHCDLAGAVWQPAWEVLDTATLVVGGTSVRTTHVRMTVQDDSKYFEHTVVDWWLDAHGLPVEMTSVKTSKSDSGLVGDVNYEETYTAMLESLQPMR